MIQVIDRAASILRVLEDHPEGQSVGEIAARVDLPRSTVHRILKSLEEEQFVIAVSREGGFRLGPALMRLASSANAWLSEHAHQLIAELSAELDETVDLAIRSGGAIYFVDQVAAANRLLAVSGIGISFPLHCTANGKALLAQLTDDEIRELLSAKLTALTPNTITDREVLIEHLAQVRTSGVAFDREEHHLGISAVGAALSNPYALPAAISVPVPTSRFTEREDELARLLLQGRDRIEKVLLSS